MLVKTNLACQELENRLTGPDELSSSMTNSLDSESDPAYQPSSSPTPSPLFPGSNCSSSKLVDLAPKRTHRRVTKVAAAKGGQDDAKQAGPSEVHFNLQAMRTEWSDIRGINNLLWVPATWLSQPSGITSPQQLSSVEAEWKKCFHYGPNTPDNSYTSDPSQDYKLKSRARIKGFVRMPPWDLGPSSWHIPPCLINSKSVSPS
jgi:hypothetical protein